ncbi:Seripauperin and TIP1 family-domain-containing protein [Scheffersomyces xylosifermentans]|uniref:Seripauperin and TIP1 family-domain-containing protein n=1 Tax=Scheffersomyces xylosifermentans TaxID=1304137 RepID=UPI00315DF47F
MQFSTIAAFTGFLVAAAKAADASDVAFLTALVNDLNSHKKDYINYIQTAKNIPAEVSTLAIKVVTYTDDSYTTMLDDPNIDVSSLENFATNLPWYTRVLAEAHVAPTGDAASGSAAKTTSAPGSASETAESKATSKTSASTSASSTSAKSSTSADSGSIKYPPAGALLGLAAIALL